MTYSCSITFQISINSVRTIRGDTVAFVDGMYSYSDLNDYIQERP